MDYVLLIAGFILLIKGADFFVGGSSSVAKLLKVPSVYSTTMRSTSLFESFVACGSLWGAVIAGLSIGADDTVGRFELGSEFESTDAKSPERVGSTASAAEVFTRDVDVAESRYICSESSSNQSGLICGNLRRIFWSKSKPGRLRPARMWEIPAGLISSISAS